MALSENEKRWADRQCPFHPIIVFGRSLIFLYPLNSGWHQTLVRWSLHIGLSADKMDPMPPPTYLCP